MPLETADIYNLHDRNGFYFVIKPNEDVETWINFFTEHYPDYKITKRTANLVPIKGFDHGDPIGFIVLVLEKIADDALPHKTI